MALAQIYADLKRDHDKQRDMLKQLAEMQGAGDDRQRLFEAFRLEVQSHAAAEEESLYATMLGNPDLRDEARHSVAEHKEVDDLIEEVEKLSADSGEWREKFGAMRHRYIHHIDEEDEELFEDMKKAHEKGEIDLDAIGETLRARQAELYNEVQDDGDLGPTDEADAEEIKSAA